MLVSDDIVDDLVPSSLLVLLMSGFSRLFYSSAVKSAASAVA